MKKMMNGNIAHLHTHTARGSLLDSIVKVEDLVEFAKNTENKSIAVTNHGKMHDYVDFYKCAKKNGVKPIIGCEIYEVKSLERVKQLREKEEISKEEEKERRTRYHLVLLAKNKIGFQNLIKIVSYAHDFLYYKPIIDLNFIKNNGLGEGLICTTACQAGRLSRGLSDNLDMKEYVDKLEEIFDDVFLEIQSHETSSQIEANNNIINFAEQNKKDLVITCDVHMPKKEDMQAHSIFVEIGEGREVGETYDGCYLQTEEEIFEKMSKSIQKEILSKAVSNTIVISDMVEDYEIGLENDLQMPDVSLLLPEDFNNTEEWYDFLIEEGFKKRGHDKKDDEFIKSRMDRLNQEKPVLKELGYLDYFVMLYLLVEEARKREIPIGESRGSGGNCQSLYYLGVTDVDSVKWKLDFSRFANLGRMSPADFDMDISKRHRKEMIKISMDLFGEENVAPICTFNTLSTKVAIRDIGKVLNDKGIYELSYKKRDEVAKLIPTIKTINDLGEEEEKETLLKDVLLLNPVLKETYDNYPLWFEYVMKLEGLPKSLGAHAAGVIISPKPIIEYCPLCLNSDKEPMLQLEMHNAMDDIKLVKMDFLGQKSLDIIDDTLKLSKLDWSYLDVEIMDLDDKDVLHEIYAKGNTRNVFQMESYEAQKMCMDCKTDSISDVIAINAFNRPGTKEGFPTYIKHKTNPDSVEVLHDSLRDVFEDSHFVMLFQEQALQIFRIAGFPEQEVDNARRAIGKKDKSVMKLLYEDFKKGLKSKKWINSQIDEIWRLMAKQAEYCFNKGHSVAYGLRSYRMAYLKHHNPLEFFTACLNNEVGNYSKLFKIIDEMKRANIEIKPPNVNKSQIEFTPDKENNNVLFGLSGIKGLGEKAYMDIIDRRPFQNFGDFLEKSENSKVDMSKKIALIKSGAVGKDKKNKMKELFEYDFYKNTNVEFKPVKSIQPKILKEELGIEIPSSEENYKEKRLTIWNEHKERAFNDRIKSKYNKKREDFQDKYMKNPELWEYETLSMFITKNPFKKALTLIEDYDNIEDGNATTLGIIVDIDKRKDKSGKQYAFVEFYNGYKNIELIFWASSYKKYSKGIYKGSRIVATGIKEGDTLTVKSAKPYKFWLKEKGLL